MFKFKYINISGQRRWYNILHQIRLLVTFSHASKNKGVLSDWIIFRCHRWVRRLRGAAFVYFSCRILLPENYTRWIPSRQRKFEMASPEGMLIQGQMIHLVTRLSGQNHLKSLQTCSNKLQSDRTSQTTANQCKIMCKINWRNTRPHILKQE